MSQDSTDSTTAPRIEPGNVTLGEQTPTQPAVPALSRGDRSRMYDIVRALINFADHDNDGQLSRAEAHGFGQVDAATVATYVAAVSPIAAANQRNAEAANAANAVSRTRRAPYALPVQQTSTIIDDKILFDRAGFLRTLSSSYNLPTGDVDRILRDVLPRGVETIRLSDKCAAHRGMNCVPINGRVGLFFTRGQSL